MASNAGQYIQCFLGDLCIGTTSEFRLLQPKRLRSDPAGVLRARLLIAQLNSVGGSTGFRQLPAGHAGEQTDEGRLEGLVEDGVDDGVEHTGRVAEPEEALKHRFVELTVGAESHRQVDDKERSPAGDEQEEHRPKDLDRLLLCLDGTQ